MNKSYFLVAVACAFVALSGCDKQQIEARLSSGPDKTVNEFQKAVDQGNVVTARQYMAPTFNGLPKDHERVMDSLLTAAENNRKHGGIEYPVTNAPCQIEGETAKCPRVLRFKDKAPTITTTVDLLKIEGNWLIRGIAKVTEESK